MQLPQFFSLRSESGFQSNQFHTFQISPLFQILKFQYINKNECGHVPRKLYLWTWFEYNFSCVMKYYSYLDFSPTKFQKILTMRWNCTEPAYTPSSMTSDEGLWRLTSRGLWISWLLNWSAPKHVTAHSLRLSSPSQCWKELKYTSSLFLLAGWPES